ncbi:MAG: class I SAM-dependent methyltransferase [Proteobacteria bacterium]|nr:class I SAM-dependent methyltransferase [Pseudomonadota bacterium]MBU1585952.1 class I SAM-dependent methyltransferase [Pseudomonadota bacterium]MBU2452218.1 class I SAM-dependent methyltransferase [Pseudomonadota bacterium]MBU2629362.1 class I SAM-dependent methyltransferase [Pseudomonadota bacterium]
MLNNKNQIILNREYCPICKSKNCSVLISTNHSRPDFFNFIKFEKYYSKELYEGYAYGILGQLLYEIAECNDCHFIYLTEVLNDVGMELLYNNWLDKELLRVHYSNLPYDIVAERILKLIKTNFSKKDKINVMDFGAGYGNFCSIAAKSDFNTFAFDLSTDKKDHMNSMGINIINNFKKYHGCFDFIWVNQVFEHLSDPLEVFINLRQCLTETGIIYAAVPDCKNIKQILNKKGLSEKLFRLLSPHQHINAFNNMSLKLLGEKAGLKAFAMIDFLKLFNTSLKLNDLKFLIKKTIKNSSWGTGLFFNLK